MQKSIAQLKTDTDNTIFTNGVEGISAALHNTLINEILDSMGEDIGVNNIKVGNGGKTIANGAIIGSGTDYFSSLDEAFSAAVGGERMFVEGTHSTTSNFASKNIVYYMNGRPQITGVSANYMWDDLGVATNFRVYGDAILNSVVAGQGVFKVDNILSQFDFNCQSIDGAGNVVVYFGSSAVGSVMRVASHIDSNVVNWTLRFRDDCNGTLICPRIDCNTFIGGLQYAVDIGGNIDGNFKIIGNIHNSSTAGQNTVPYNFTGTGKITIEGDIYENPNGYTPGFWTDQIIYPIQGNLEHIGNVFSNGVATDRYIVESTFSGGSTFKHSGGKWESSSTNPLTNITGDRTTILEGEYIANAAAIVLETAQTTGLFSVDGLVHNKTNSPGDEGVHFGSAAGYAAIIVDAKIIIDVGVGGFSVNAGAAKNVMVYKHCLSNVDKGANISDIIGGGGFVFNPNVI